MQAAMIVSWDQPIPGREAKSLEYGAEVMDFWGKQAADGHCSPPEWFFSERGHGLWMVKGDRDKLLEIAGTEDATLLMVKGQLLLEHFCVDYYMAGEAADDFLGMYAKGIEAVA